ncbi:FHA domain-containing protein [Subtercola sp. PAMC28395]|uniref:FHA domain-containing protein n=1 Tax=Subtercola sp. PAMC28395 TaxID=2846775 RepID=UPI001C0B9D10|nr:FHA domain-containing protein [Subtercola sp. PAMC28395]QWT24552.1 FHA domain-containing protein [Subtercola sp. PAMC28395]
MTHRYAPGAWFGIVADGGVALLPALSSPKLLHEVYEALKEGKGLGALLEALTGTFGTSLADLPSFAVVAFVGDEVLIAVRGPLSVFIEGDADVGSFAVSGARVTTWSESISTTPRSVVISSMPAGAIDFILPIDSGVVLCAGVECMLSESSPRVPAVVSPLPVVAPVQPEAIGPVVAPKVDPVPVETPVSVETATGESVGAPSVSVETATPFDDTTGLLYDEMLSGETVASSVERAAVRPSDEPETEPEPESERVDVRRSVGPVITVKAPALPPPPMPNPSPAPGGMIVGVPRFGSGISAELQSDFIPEAQGDHDGETVSMEQVQALRAAAARESAGFAGQSGSAGPPASSAGVAPAVSAGRLLVSTGAEVELDRDVVIGRKPSAGRVSAGSMPHLVTVPSPDQDISRNHLAIRREGIHVFAVDLDTTNGTRLYRPGRAPERLHPQEPTMLANGDLLDLGDGVSVVFEAPQ